MTKRAKSKKKRAVARELTHSNKADQILQQAISFHRAGDLHQAEKLYSKLLETAPNEPDALHLLGLVAFQKQDLEVAQNLILRAITANSKIAQFHNSLGKVRAAQQNFEEAVTSYRTALRLKPDLADAHSSLGIALYEQGKVDEAIVSYRRALALEDHSPETLNNFGNALKKQGAIDEAAGYYREAVAIKQDFPAGWNNLAVIYKEQGQLQEAADLCLKALEIRPDFAPIHCTLGSIYRSQGRRGEATSVYRKALELNPQLVDAWFNLGNVLKEQNQLDEAIQAYKRVIELKSDFSEAWNNLGTVLKDSGRPQDALSCYQKALELDPRFAIAANNLGSAFKELQNFDEAMVWYRRANELSPGLAQAPFNMGLVFQQEGKMNEAIAAFRQAIEVNSEFVEAYNQLGRCLADTGNHREGVRYYLRALEITPDNATVCNHLAISLQELGEHDEAVRRYKQAIRLRPTFAKAFNNLAGLYLSKGKLQVAAILFERAIRLDPDYAEAHSNLGNVLIKQGKPLAAVEKYKRALALNPELTDTYSNYLLSLHYDQFLDASELFSEHKKWSSRVTTNRINTLPPHKNDQSKHRRLRIGYVSPDFRRHSVAFFIAPLMAAHDRDAFEIICFSNVSQPDKVTEQIQSLADRWVNIAGLSDEEAARTIYEEQVDILVDLAGHTARNNLLAFARKPAPVQATYLGYPNTTGLEAVDYRITDLWADRADAEDLHTEQLVRLPGGFLCFGAPQDTPEVGDLAALQAGRVTFGSFNNRAKVTLKVVEIWAQILNSVPHAKLLLKNHSFADRRTCRELHAAFRQFGVEEQRIELLSYVRSYNEHLDIYNQVDIGLDTFPYNGTTTTCEAMWMGVPIISLAGSSHASRVGVSLLKSVGLADWIAETETEYVCKAVESARDLERLQSIRRSLRQKMMESPLCNSQRLARSLEMFYREVWTRWCGNEHAGPQKATDNKEQNVFSEASGTTLGSNDRRVPANAWRDDAMDENESLIISVQDGLRICAPPSIELMTPYVLLEQEDWFDDEIDFVRAHTRPGMRVIDIGADYGQYTLSMARRVGPYGEVWAFEQLSEASAYLENSLRVNELTQVKLVQTTLSEGNKKTCLQRKIDESSDEVEPDCQRSQRMVKLQTLDDCCREYEWEGISFLRLDAKGNEVNILRGGEEFLWSESPLIMIKLHEEVLVSLTLIEEFAKLEYSCYRLVPGLQMLVPYASEDPTERVQPNLFFCKKDRARFMEEQGWLTRYVAGPGILPQVSEPLWPDYIRSQPYSGPLLALWNNGNVVQGTAGRKEYLDGLDYYVVAHSMGVPGVVRYACLVETLRKVSASARETVHLSRLQMLARVTRELGLRDQAVRTLNILANLFRSMPELHLDEPFLPVAGSLDQHPPAGDIGTWCLASILKQQECLKSYSSYFDGRDSLENLELFRSLGFQDAEMERRYQLIRMRFGLQSAPVQTPILAQQTEDNLNPHFWCEAS